MERDFIPEKAVGFFQITGLGAVVTLQAAWDAWVVGDTTRPAMTANQYVLIIDCEGDNCRYRADGTDPTTAIGNRIVKDTQLVYTANALSAMRFIGETAACKLNVGIYRNTF